MDRINTSPSSELTALLETFSIPDAPKLAAYNAFSPQYRTVIKQAIALTAWRFQTCKHTLMPSFEQREVATRIISQHQDLDFSLKRQPLDWVTIILDANYQATARLTALACLCVLTGVEQIYVLFVDTQDPQPNLLLSLELCGIEECLQLPSTAVANFLSYLKGYGGLIYLTKPLPLLEETPILFQESKPPCICVEDADLFSTDLITFLHGSVTLETELSSATDLLLCSQEAAAKFLKSQILPHLLILTPNTVGYWRYQHLTVDTFCLTQEVLVK